MTSRLKLELPTTIGADREFAINVDLDEAFGDEWLFGKIGYVIGNTLVGDYNLGASLRDVLLQMHLIFSDAGKRETSRFVGKGSDDLFDTVWSTLYGDGRNGLEDVANEECWAKHDITIPIDVFDNVRVFQFDEGAVSRIIWKAIGENMDESVHEVVTPRGATEQVFQRLHALLESLVEWENLRR
jgi:hypothetical protein